jgi:hypothetical protein
LLPGTPFSEASATNTCRSKSVRATCTLDPPRLQNFRKGPLAMPRLPRKMGKKSFCISMRVGRKTRSQQIPKKSTLSWMSQTSPVFKLPLQVLRPSGASTLCQFYPISHRPCMPLSQELHRGQRADTLVQLSPREWHPFPDRSFDIPDPQSDVFPASASISYIVSDQRQSIVSHVSLSYS